MILGWLLDFSLLWLALTRTVRDGSRPHQPGKTKGTPRVWSFEAPSENTKTIQIILGLDVEKANIQKSMLSFSQFMSRDKDSNKEDKTRSMMGPPRKKEGLKRTAQFKAVSAQR